MRVVPVHQPHAEGCVVADGSASRSFLEDGWRSTDYIPDLPSDAWGDIKDFVLTTVAKVRDRVPYNDQALINAVARHVDWTVSIAGFDLDAQSLFRRDVIGAAVSLMPTTSTSTMGRRRSLLLRVGEVLGVIPVPTPLPPLAASSPSAPYSARDVEKLLNWAYRQGNPGEQQSARALLALGLGAGLPTRDIGNARAEHIGDAGSTLVVPGPPARVIPVAPDWAEELSEVRHESAPSDLLFQPHVNRTKNYVTVFVSRTMGAGIRPSTQRMRSTWLVEHLATGTPMQDLLYAAGLQSMDSLIRYEKFLPQAVPADQRGTR